MSLDKKHLGSGRFIDANYPDYIVVRDVHEGDVKGKMELSRAVKIDEAEDLKPRRGIFKPMHEIFKKRKNKKVYRYANHYGEYVAYRIAEEIGVPACIVDMAKRKHTNKYTRKTSDIEGCISYIHKLKGDSVVSGITILEEYRREVLEKQGIQSNASDNNNIDTIIKAVDWYLRKKSDLSNQRINEILKSIVEMTVFDCAFGNSDRNDDNWGIWFKPNEEDINQRVELYPTYDNERILGFMEREDIVRSILENDQSVKRYHNETLLSRIGFPPEKEKVNYKDMINYMLEHYPEWTRSGLDKVLNLKEKDLEEILDECEGLEDSYKSFSMAIFKDRRENIRQCLNEYYLKQSSRKYEGEEL